MLLSMNTPGCGGHYKTTHELVNIHSSSTAKFTSCFLNLLFYTIIFNLHMYGQGFRYSMLYALFTTMFSQQILLLMT